MNTPHPTDTLADLGEDRLVAALTRHLALGGDVRVGAGDDCAVIGRPRDARWQLLKTDAVIEGVHFLPEDDPRRVGWKALCRAISDIAAMGGVPAHALITLAAPRSTPVAKLEALYAGLRKAARKFGVSIVGGETARSPGPLFVNVALTGWVERARCVLRSGGRPGDALYVTGRLGGSRAGKHLDFTPRLAEARWLVTHFKLHAMMDLSDGLAADLPRLASASRCGFEILHEKLPRISGTTVEQALTDGEDFELLFALAPRDTARLEIAWRKQFPKLPLTHVGTLAATFHAQHSTLNFQPVASIISHSVEETIDHGRTIAVALRRGDVLALCGDLGAGKTHFVKGLAAGLGASAAVTSPTFTLIHEYPGGCLPLYHFDFYRLDDEDEAIKIGLDEYLDGDGVCVIEWADKFPALLPAHSRWLRFTHRSDGAREIEETA